MLNSLHDAKYPANFLFGQYWVYNGPYPAIVVPLVVAIAVLMLPWLVILAKVSVTYQLLKKVGRPRAMPQRCTSVLRYFSQVPAFIRSSWPRGSLARARRHTNGRPRTWR